MFSSLKNISTVAKNFQSRNFITVVNQAEVAYRQFLGMNRVRLEPGLRLCLPVFHQIDRVDLREDFVSVQNMNAYTSDNVPVTVSGSLFFKVTDAEKACFSVGNYVQSVASVGESTARSVVGKFPYDKIISQRNEINTELVKTIDTSISQWGVDCTRFEITDFGPQNEQVSKYLEKQMEAERRRRENELNTQASIRTSEGERDSVKLKSDANFYQVKLEADSKAYSVEQSALAQAKQIEILKKSFPNLSDAQITDFMLELERQKNLNAIARNNSNAVYFVDPKNMYPMQRHITMDKQNE
jgi:regulator of protease activity HflC (stomatin/prohibitin superfamily)